MRDQGQAWWRNLYFRWVLLLAAILVACSDVDRGGEEETLGTVSQALCSENQLTVVSATASSIENNDPNLAAGKATDGNIGTRWASTWSDPQWIKLDLGSSKFINRVLMKWERAASRHYEVQVSDNGIQWRTRFVQPNRADCNEQSNICVDDITNLNTTGRYVRIYSHSRTTQYGVSLWEIQVFGNTNVACAPPPSGLRDPLGSGLKFRA